MKFDVYCDESRPEALTSKAQNAARYLVIGSLWLPGSDRAKRKAEVHSLKDSGKIGGELKWSKVSASRLATYTGLIDWFFDAGQDLRFRAIVVDRTKLDMVKFHNGDGELGFYKFYYFLLHGWVLDLNEYQIFCDLKRNREQDRLHVLRRVLVCSNLTSQIQSVQGIESAESVLIQAVDLMTGMVAARFNESLNPGTAKTSVVEHLERRMGHGIRHTPKAEEKFNVFAIRPGGGW
ncbi:MAG: DUF3800 domain-containing protein [Desulfovibrionales bacterium]|nr:DUF3800 domain-containing protein [Desulfovibrionales bacterium]